MQSFLAKRYKAPVAKMIAQIFDFSTPIEFDPFVETIEEFLNFKTDQVFELAFKIYDYD